MYIHNIQSTFPSYTIFYCIILLIFKIATRPLSSVWHRPLALSLPLSLEPGSAPDPAWPDCLRTKELCFLVQPPPPSTSAHLNSPDPPPPHPPTRPTPQQSLHPTPTQSPSTSQCLNIVSSVDHRGHRTQHFDTGHHCLCPVRRPIIITVSFIHHYSKLFLCLNLKRHWLCHRPMCLLLEPWRQRSETPATTCGLIPGEVSIGCIRR